MGSGDIQTLRKAAATGGSVHTAAAVGGRAVLLQRSTVEALNRAVLDQGAGKV